MTTHYYFLNMLNSRRGDMRELRADVHGQDEARAAEDPELALQVRLLLHRLRRGLAHHEAHEGQGKDVIQSILNDG